LQLFLGVFIVFSKEMRRDDTKQFDGMEAEKFGEMDDACRGHFRETALVSTIHLRGETEELLKLVPCQWDGISAFTDELADRGVHLGELLDALKPWASMNRLVDFRV
ncbi:hypothetical protein NIM86_17020, partial [Notoacmeibacter sp. MSK16QG-6]|nr:hypothetical protein [Notoacmeibacter sp. MSK16QG-6]